jgi:hypothetical protein
MKSALDTKRIEWAYPSSPLAERFGLSKSGCYVVEIISGITKQAKPVAGCATIYSAEATARSYACPWATGTLRDPSEWINLNNSTK